MLSQALSRCRRHCRVVAAVKKIVAGPARLFVKSLVDAAYLRDDFHRSEWVDPGQTSRAVRT